MRLDNEVLIEVSKLLIVMLMAAMLSTFKFFGDFNEVGL